MNVGVTQDQPLADPFTREQLKKLRSALITLYPDIEAARVVVQDSGLSIANVRLDGTIQSVWDNLLREAINQGHEAVLALLREVLEAYPQNETVRNELGRLAGVHKDQDSLSFIERVAGLFRISGHDVKVNVQLGPCKIQIIAEELQGFVRKVNLVECAGDDIVDVAQLRSAKGRFDAVKGILKDKSLSLIYVAQADFTPEASGYALESGIHTFTLSSLTHRMINFDRYIAHVENEAQRSVIMKEYQPTSMHYEGHRKESKQAIKFVKDWLETDSRWLTVLGDYGVGKSWMLKRLLYTLIDDYKRDPMTSPLPLFVPLQRFTKAFDFKTLIIATFQIYGLAGVHYSAFEYMVNEGRIIFLLDSFDEMAQSLGRQVLRENLNELLISVSHKSRAIMTSRPTYFDSRAERLQVVERHGELVWHQQDEEFFKNQTALAREVAQRLERASFARLNDLTDSQRTQLFKIVLEEKPEAYATLMDLYGRFRNLKHLSQRAVIARLLTTVAETLASKQLVETIDGEPLLPDDLATLNQAKIFEIVIHNLLRRDYGIGSLSSTERLRFLRSYAIFLQAGGHDPFATPSELRELVRKVFVRQLQATDTPAQLLENYYRTCRRHSGLTTEGQFKDTAGNIDMPVDELDTDSRVGFSHNSLREYLVADALVDVLLRKETTDENIHQIAVTDAIGQFIIGISEYKAEIPSILSELYASNSEIIPRELIFKIIYHFVVQSRSDYLKLLGMPVQLVHLDICGLDLSGWDLQNALIGGCLAADTNFKEADLRGSNFAGTVLERVMLDGARLNGSDFRRADVVSLYVYDEYDKGTTLILSGRDARQWLFSHGAHVEAADLNPLMGKEWYEAAREVTRTLERRLSGTHQDSGLSKGTKTSYRRFAGAFVEFLKSRGILEKRMRSASGDGWVVRVNPEHYETIVNFSQKGIVCDELKPFFDKHLAQMAEPLS